MLCACCVDLIQGNSDGCIPAASVNSKHTSRRSTVKWIPSTASSGGRCILRGGVGVHMCIALSSNPAAVSESFSKQEKDLRPADTVVPYTTAQFSSQLQCGWQDGRGPTSQPATRRVHHTRQRLGGIRRFLIQHTWEMACRPQSLRAPAVAYGHTV
jgi:hypothetical protein